MMTMPWRDASPPPEYGMDPGEISDRYEAEFCTVAQGRDTAGDLVNESCLGDEAAAFLGGLIAAEAKTESAVWLLCRNVVLRWMARTDNESIADQLAQFDLSPTWDEWVSQCNEGDDR